MNSPSLTIDTPAGPVRATACPREADAVVFDLGGAMRGHVHVTGTHRPQRWDQFTALRACLGPVNSFQTTAPADALPRLASSRTGYRGSLTLYRDDADRLVVMTYPMMSATDREPTKRTASVLTAVLQACAAQVAQRRDLSVILDASRRRDTPALLRFLTWSSSHSRTQAAQYEQQALAARVEEHDAVAAWWTVARLFTGPPSLVLLLMLADFPGSLSRTASVAQSWARYCLAAAADEHAYARRARAEAASLRAQLRPGSRSRCASDGAPEG
ncbi:hypothetical protein [Streptomyces spectabilis]|uniref:Uncharacterized protein n=1 Tax=Streptomyces spectabilis TaxID=68270 RepID=A0A7W8EZD0_STRST|nr:hypothetical protein [Streptomyces spectabilis]MBB5109303.1 hypothetical protein [Streptomyces spectabilis]GGV52324.1 hypothetical protein GCM10010245_82310 [Streptomyces spectabilis]